jgi:flagellar biosynthetic protein FliR
MSIHLQLAWLAMIVLASMRMTALLLFTPVLGGANVPVQARVVMLLAFTALMLAALPTATHGQALPNNVPAIALSGLTELLIGTAMAFGLHCAFGALTLAGRMLDLQIGFSVGEIFDPVTRAPSPLLGTLLTMLGTVIFYAMDGHHLLLRMVAYSFEKVPVGDTMPWHAAKPFLDQFGVMFALGLTLAGPVVVALLLVDLGLGIVSRTMPQMNVFLIGIIVKIVVGLLIFALALSGMADVARRVFMATFHYWQTLLP